MARYRYRIRGMDCPGCADKVSSAAESLPNVRSARAHLMNERLEVETDDPNFEPECVCDVVRELGYGIELEARQKRRHDHDHDPGHDHDHEHDHDHDHAHDEGVSRREITEILIAAAFWFTGVWLHWSGIESWISHFPSAVAALVAGYRVYWSAFRALRRGRLTFNVLMSIAVVGAIAIDEWSEAAAVVVLFAIAEMLESFSVGRARRAVRALIEEMPEQVRVRRNDEAVTVPVEEVEVGEVVLVRPGEKIGLDGEVLRGETQVNESAITGESRLVPKRPGDLVYAGTLNDTGAIEFRVEKPAEDTVLSRMIELIAQAEQAKSRSERFVDRFAQVYTPLLVLVAAGLTAVPVLAFGAPFEVWFYRSLVVLVAGCPCALVLSAPVAVTCGLTRSSRLGILIKGGVFLEQLGYLRAFAFDKTGTLTRGQPAVVEVVPFSAQSPEELLRRAAEVEHHSEHTLARAITAAAKSQGLQLNEGGEFTAFPGRGGLLRLDGEERYVGNRRLFEELGTPLEQWQDQLQQLEAEGHTLVLIGTAAELEGVLVLDDPPRPESRSAIETLRKLGVRHVEMLTGDAEPVARRIAQQVGISTYRAGLLPEDKVGRVQELVREFQGAAMVGDGINDAPALAAATVGASLAHQGTDVSRETADVILMGDDLAKLPTAVRISRATRRMLHTNVAVAVGSKFAIIVLAALGLSPLWLAVAADTGISLLLVSNSLRLLRWQPGPLHGAVKR